jgi:hypothetical protein
MQMSQIHDGCTLLLVVAFFEPVQGRQAVSVFSCYRVAYRCVNFVEIQAERIGSISLWTGFHMFRAFDIDSSRK